MMIEVVDDVIVIIENICDCLANVCQGINPLISALGMSKPPSTSLLFTVVRCHASWIPFMISSKLNYKR